jgi:hypothetical protein
MKDLKKYQWKNRVIILKDRSVESPTLKRAKERLMREMPEFKERDVVILEEGASSDFKIELYGKDGGKKCVWDADFSVKEIFEKIDSMPPEVSR